MDVQKEAARLNKKNEKLITILTDRTVLTQATRTAKENEAKNLQQQVAALQQYLPGQGVKKVINQ